MPLIAVAVVAYASGLLGGFGFGSSVTGILGLTAIALGALHRGLIVVAGGAAIAAGALVAGTNRLSEIECERGIAGAFSWRLVVEERAAPGAFVRAHAADCSTTLGLAVESGRAEAGSTVIARGDITPGQRGYVVRHAKLVATGGPDWVTRWRARATAAFDRVFPMDAPLARALLVADMRELSPEIRDRYAAAGLAHMLSISGLHVGIIDRKSTRLNF